MKESQPNGHSQQEQQQQEGQQDKQGQQQDGKGGKKVIDLTVSSNRVRDTLLREMPLVPHAVHRFKDACRSIAGQPAGCVLCARLCFFGCLHASAKAS